MSALEQEQKLNSSPKKSSKRALRSKFVSSPLRFIKICLWTFVLASFGTWLYLSYVRAESNEVIIIEDKYKGLNPQAVILPTQHRFILKRIFPKRIVLHRIQIEPRMLRFNLKKALSQSEALNLDDSFYIKYQLHLEYRIKADQAYKLFKKLAVLDWSYLDTFLKMRLNFYLQRRISDFYENDADIPLLASRLDNYFIKEALLDLNKELSLDAIEFLNLIPLSIFVPNFEHYQALLESRDELLEKKNSPYTKNR